MNKYPCIPKRIGATIIDYLVIFGVFLVYLYTVGTHMNGEYRVTGIPALFPEVFWFAYIILTERYLGGTMGHQLMGLKVVSQDGNELVFRAHRICIDHDLQA